MKPKSQINFSVVKNKIIKHKIIIKSVINGNFL